MSILALHLLSAMLAAARAIDNARRVAYAVQSEGTCGEWKATWHDERGIGCFVAVASRADEVNLPTGFPGEWEDLNDGLSALTSDRAPDWGVADWSGAARFDEGSVLGAIATIDARYPLGLPEGFDWKTWEPQGVPA